MAFITLSKEMDNRLTIVNINKTSLYFIHEKLIGVKAYIYNKEFLFVNKDYRFSSVNTTSIIKNIKQSNNLSIFWVEEQVLIDVLKDNLKI